ncbi:MAG: hypothetical protein A2W91_16395 [Bacteroidetes bacterium GWF2_38_335]|nr:MAG: hypothetical protein A2W91_16395 [Bacteroidetes bacterium GWF2_38_335]OFY81268.1 MAG: hypothetical protein A2281_07370 [Bacteroidetes bacterium RIFOXYA12_FULL_38_20]HBS85387.1 hypothetical protein [Bacteroidales bacterium]
MKNKFWIFGLAFLLSVSFVNCNNDDEDDDLPPVDEIPNGTMVATINGASWSTDEAKAFLAINGGIAIQGIADDGSNISISAEELAVGTYTIDFMDTENTAAYNVDNSGSTVTYTVSKEDMGGELVITSINTTDSLMSGTFHFVLFRHSDSTSVSITEGEFVNIPYTKELPVVDGNDMSCKIDGTVFNPTTISGTDMIVLNGTNGTTTVGLAMPATVTAGTYSLTSIGDYRGIYSVGSTINYSSTSGTLVVTSHDSTTRRIEGTFTFVANNFAGTGTNVNITEGSFAITYLD